MPVWGIEHGPRDWLPGAADGVVQHRKRGHGGRHPRYCSLEGDVVGSSIQEMSAVTLLALLTAGAVSGRSGLLATIPRERMSILLR